MKKYINGFDNEKMIAQYLNKRKVSDLNTNMTAFLSFLFNSPLDNESIIGAKVLGSGIKPDLSISIDNVTKLVSIKKGDGNSVHQEPIEQFLLFLYENEASYDITNSLLKFHYGDGTIDNTGLDRVTASVFKKNNPEIMKTISVFFNSEPFLTLAVDRFIFSGVNSNHVADAIYHGTVDDGVWARREEVLSYAKSYENSIPYNANFSFLNYQIWNRNIKRNPNTESRRNVMQVKWPMLRQNLEEICNGR